MSKARALCRLISAPARQLQRANLRSTTRNLTNFPSSLPPKGSFYSAIPTILPDDHSEIPSAEVLSRLSIFDAFPRPQASEQERAVEKGQGKENVQDRKDGGDSQVHTPIVNGGRGYKSEPSPERSPLTEVDSAAGDATENTDLQEAGTGGGTSGYWGDHGGGANAGGSVGEFGVFGGFDGSA